MTRVATCILMDEKGKILILKRSNKVRTYKGYWSGVAGYVEEGEKPVETALKEIREETGLNNEDVELLKILDPIEFTDFYEEKKYEWKIYPFLFKVRKKSKVQIDWEHTKYRWINPSEIDMFEAVPRLRDVILKLLK